MRHSKGYILAIICLIAFPCALALGWYLNTNTSLLRLYGGGIGQTDQQNDRQNYEIVAHVHWDHSNEVQPSSAFTQSLVTAFDYKEVDLRVVVDESPAQGTAVTYEIGASRIGPFPKAQAVKGVNAAIEAYRMLTADPRGP